MSAAAKPLPCARRRCVDPLEGLPRHIAKAMLEAKEHHSTMPAPATAVAATATPTLLVFENPDKMGAGSRSGKEPFMPAWPFRMLLTGPPHSGKRNAALNIIVRLDPPPSKIFVIHLDPNTKEYDMLSDIAPTETFSPDDPPNFSELEEADGATGRPLVIIDEVASKLMPGEARKALTQLLTYGSTHKNTSIMMMYQNLTSVDPAQRRCFNLFALWKNADDAVVNLAAHRVGVPPEEMGDLMSLCKKPQDFIVVDTTRSPADPYRFRLNLIHPINRISSADESAGTQ